MSLRVDLNADMGESFGAWKMGDDAALLEVVTSANIACGCHAGDWDMMARTMAEAAKRGVGIGAHPGFADLQGFGRRRMHLPPDSLGNLVRYQVAAAEGMARAQGARLAHVKLHGAMSNMASEDIRMARTAYAAAAEVAPGAVMVVLAGTVQQAACEALGLPYAAEIFADRAYNDDATLVDRSAEGAIIHDPEIAAARIVKMVQDGAIHTATGKHIPVRIDTVCTHGDTPQAIEIARTLRSALEDAGITVQRFGHG